MNSAAGRRSAVDVSGHLPVLAGSRPACQLTSKPGTFTDVRAALIDGAAVKPLTGRPPLFNFVFLVFFLNVPVTHDEERR